QSFASLAQEDVSKAAEAYQAMEKDRPSDAIIGLGDLAIYEGRYKEAAAMLQSGAAANAAVGRREDAADKLSTLAYTQLLRGDKAAALDALKSALAVSQAAKTRFVAGRV